MPKWGIARDKKRVNIYLTTQSKWKVSRCTLHMTVMAVPQRLQQFRFCHLSVLSSMECSCCSYVLRWKGVRMLCLITSKRIPRSNTKGCIGNCLYFNIDCMIGTYCLLNVYIGSSSSEKIDDCKFVC